MKMKYITIVKNHYQTLFITEKSEDGFIRQWYPKSYGYIKNPKTNKMIKCELFCIAHDPKSDSVIATWQII